MATKVGLTGGIGSGKSTVAQCFVNLGVRVIDADQVARRLTASGSSQFVQIVRAFKDEVGAALLDADGNLARDVLAEVVFNSDQKRKRLEAILHPPIRRAMYAEAAQAEGAYCVLDIPLLVENGQYRDMQRVVVVTSETGLREQRLSAQRGLSRQRIRQIMANQASDAARRAVSDDVIDNNGRREDLESQVAALHLRYQALFARPSVV